MFQTAGDGLISHAGSEQVLSLHFTPIHNQPAKSVVGKVGIAAELCHEQPRQCYDECVSEREMYFSAHGNLAHLLSR